MTQATKSLKKKTKLFNLALCCGMCPALFIISLSATAQLQKAERNFNNYEYGKAIPFYEKELNGKDSAKAFAALADCYFFTGNYEQAEAMHRKMALLPSAKPAVFFNFGKILQYNGKYAEAKEQFLKYAAANPQDGRGETFAKACDIRASKDSVFGTVVKNLSHLNTPFSEFAPFVSNERFYFASDRPKNYIEHDWQNLTMAPFTAVYSSAQNENESEKQFQTVVEKINTAGHNGPVSFSRNNEAVFMRIEEKKIRRGKKINTAKIFEAKIENGKFSAIIPFPFNSDDYSCGHPSISPDGQTLFFVSDMPGGLGGKDIYFCKKENAAWSAPVNAGHGINTAGDDVFPFVKSDSVIYFSSNGRPGHGGMDVFSSFKTNDEWKTFNLKMPVNSNADDFGIFFSDERKGFFSSNRNGGKGKEDLYEFQIIASYITGELFSPDRTSLKGIKLYLLSADGTVMDSVITSDSGFFIFSKLNPNKEYMIMMQASDVEFQGFASFDANPAKRLKFLVADKLNKIIDTIFTDDEHFLSSMLPYDEIDIQGKITTGGTPPVSFPNIGVLLKTENGDVLSSTVTDRDGNYEFKNIKRNRNYLITIDESNPAFDNNMKYVILGNIFSKGKTLLESDIGLWFGNKFDEKIFFMALDRNRLYRFEYLPSAHYAFRISEATNVKWEKIDLGAKEDNKMIVVIESIYFETDRWDILPGAETVLNKAIEFLKSHPEVKMELSAHTDSRASDKYNLELSEKRALAAMHHIVARGIDQQQLKATGYGETKLLNKCKNDVPCSEEEHKINRRMEFKILWN